jgi:membrane-associated phospholipid phosphatase
VLKYSVRQERPDSTQRNSFPSGHTTTAFAFAAVVGEEHGWRWGVPAYALATLVGWSRMNDNKHYLHDVLAGATIGTSVGLGVVRKMRQRQPLNEVRAEVLPMLLSDGGMLMFSRNW